MKQGHAIQVVFERNAFYRRMHFLALTTISLVILTIVILLTVFYYLVKNPTHPVYFATDRLSRLIPVIPVTVPNMTTEEVIAWTIKAVEASFAIDFINYRAQFQNAQNYFTPYGWQKFIAANQASNNLLAILSRKYVVVAKVVEKPMLVTEGILGGAYAWKFRMPLLLTYRFPPFDERSKYLNALNLEVIVQRQEILQSRNGLGIVQIIGQQVTGSTQPQSISGTSTT